MDASLINPLPLNFSQTKVTLNKESAQVSVPLDSNLSLDHWVMAHSMASLPSITFVKTTFHGMLLA